LVIPFFAHRSLKLAFSICFLTFFKGLLSPSFLHSFPRIFFLSHSVEMGFTVAVKANHIDPPQKDSHDGRPMAADKPMLPVSGPCPALSGSSALPGSLPPSPVRQNNPYSASVIDAEHRGKWEQEFDDSWNDNVPSPLYDECANNEDDGEHAAGYADALLFHDEADGLSGESCSRFSLCEDEGQHYHPFAGTTNRAISEYASAVWPSARRMPSIKEDHRAVVRLHHKKRWTGAFVDFPVRVGDVVLVERLSKRGLPTQTDCGLVAEKISLQEFQSRVSSRTLPVPFPASLPTVKVLQIADSAQCEHIRKLEAMEAALTADIRGYIRTLPGSADISLIDVETCEFQYDEKLVYVYFRAAKLVKFRPLLDVIFSMCGRPVWMHQVDRTPFASANTSVSSSSSAPPEASSPKKKR
jgi:hypothetical protein